MPLPVSGIIYVKLLRTNKSTKSEKSYVEIPKYSLTPLTAVATTAAAARGHYSKFGGSRHGNVATLSLCPPWVVAAIISTSRDNSDGQGDSSNDNDEGLCAAACSGDVIPGRNHRHPRVTANARRNVFCYLSLGNARIVTSSSSSSR